MSQSTMIRIVALGVLIAVGLYVAKRFQYCAMPQPSGASPIALRVVNVLSQDYYQDAHITGSESVPFEDVVRVARSWDKAVPVVFYCSNYWCTASSAAVALLKKQGFVDVRAYEGGMAEWYQLAQRDVQYQYEGPAREGYLQEVVEPSQEHAHSYSISAQDLLALMQQKGLITPR